MKVGQLFNRVYHSCYPSATPFIEPKATKSISPIRSSEKQELLQENKIKKQVLTSLVSD